MEIYESEDKRVNEFMWVFENIVENLYKEEMFDTKEGIMSLVRSIEKNPEETKKALLTVISCIEDMMKDKLICPECGGRIECEEDSRGDIYADCDCGWAKVASGYRWRCENCHEEYEL